MVDVNADLVEPTIKPGWIHQLLAIVKAVTHEPIFHFFLVGGLIFAASAWYQKAAGDHVIVFNNESAERLEELYLMQFAAQPPEETMAFLAGQYIDEEVLYRYGIALGLDRNDEVIRRRVVQKSRFLLEDTNVPSEPDEHQLGQYFESHIETYKRPERVSFTHIFFSPDNGGEKVAEARAKEALAKLKDGVMRAPELGDRFFDQIDYVGLGQAELSRLFGPVALSQEVFNVAVGRWSGPIRSGFGWHLVRVTEHQLQTVPEYSSVRDAVRLDYLADAQKENNKRAFEDLKRQYTIVRKDNLTEALAAFSRREEEKSRRFPRASPVREND